MLKDVGPKGRATAVKGARRLRREMTLPEVILWQALRKQSAGLKFRRQHPTGSYILDFYCMDARLAVEIDGEAHNREDRPARDAARAAWLLEAGIATLRTPAVAAFKDAEMAVRGIVADAMARLTLHHLAGPGGPPPRGELGEE